MNLAACAHRGAGTTRGRAGARAFCREMRRIVESERETCGRYRLPNPAQVALLDTVFISIPGDRDSGITTPSR